MQWFGGFNNPTAPPRTPVGNTRPWPTIPGFWMVGQWTEDEVRTTHTGRRFVAVIGPCAMTPGDLMRLGKLGAPDDVARRWPGSYTTVEITDAYTRVWTDIGGAWPISTTSADGGVYWASSSRALAGLTGAGPDVNHLAAWLLAPSVPLPGGRSMFEGVELVPPGHCLTASQDSSVQIRRVWSPQARPGSAAGRLRAELSAAVAVRVRTASAPTVDLSGGCDSTALALLAHALARPDQPVIGVTVHPAGHTAGGDLDYARSAAERSGITHRLMPLDFDQVPYTALNAVPVTDEPAPSTIAHARFSGQLRWMRETLRTDCHMTGDGGDSLLCSPPIMLADLLATGRYRRAMAETIRWARLRRLPVWSLLKSAFRTSHESRADALVSLSRRMLAGTGTAATEGDIGWCATDPVPPWATDETRKRAAAIMAALLENVDEPLPGSFAMTIAAAGMADVGRSARADVQLAEAVGVPLHNPFTDSRVVDAYLSVPLDERPGPADYKPVLRDAVADLFPTDLVARCTKGDFNPDHYHGMRANLAELHALADGRLSALNLVDPTEFQRTLTMTAAGLPVPFSTVEPAVATEVWLRALEDAPGIPWSPLVTTGVHV